MKRIIFLIFMLFSFKLYNKTFEPLKIITENWPPYNYLENGKIKGFSYEIVQYIMTDLKINSNIEILSGARSEKILNNYSRVIFFSLFRTPEREDKYKWIGPISKEKLFFYKKRGSSVNISNLEDAKKVERISTRDNGLIYNFLLQNKFNNLDPSTNNESIYIKVIIGRNDLAIGESEMGVIYLLKKLKKPLNSLEKTEVCLINYPLYIAATKDIPDSEIKLWQNSFDRMKSSGEYEKILKKYMK